MVVADIAEQNRSRHVCPRIHPNGPPTDGHGGAIGAQMACRPTDPSVALAAELPAGGGGDLDSGARTGRSRHGDGGAGRAVGCDGVAGTANNGFAPSATHAAHSFGRFSGRPVRSRRRGPQMAATQGGAGPGPVPCRPAFSNIVERQGRRPLSRCAATHRHRAIRGRRPERRLGDTRSRAVLT